MRLSTRSRRENGTDGGPKGVCKVENRTLGGSVGAVCWRQLLISMFFFFFFPIVVPSVLLPGKTFSAVSQQLMIRLRTLSNPGSQDQVQVGQAKWTKSGH